jgi:hypothetical protein
MLMARHEGPLPNSGRTLAGAFRFSYSIDDVPWSPRPTYRPPGDRDTPGSKAHSGSHASTAARPRYPRVGRTAPQDLGGYRFQDNRAFLGWDMQPALPFDTLVVSDSNDLPAILHPCSPLIMAYVCPDATAFGEVSAGSFA